jgi:hypothetical protein
MDDPRKDIDNLPGLGLAAYTGLLGCLCLLGVAGIFGGTMLLIQPDKRAASPLMPGAQVGVWRLAPLRKAGVLDITTVPLAFHDESLLMTGSTACAMLHDRIIRVEEEQGTQIFFAEITDVQVDEAESVTLTGPEGSLRCHFGPGEGGTRFARQIETERSRAHSAD